MDNEKNAIRIPMNHNIRSLNLSNSVAIVLYEALRREQLSGGGERRTASPAALAQ